MRRRSDGPVSTQTFLGEACDSRLDWPGKTVRLGRNSMLDYQHRPASAHVSVAELYHENSKLFPHMVGELAVTRVNLDDFRREFIRRRAALVAARSPKPDLDGAWRGVLRGTSSVVRPELFYAVELRIVVDNVLAAHEAKTDTLQVLKRLTPEDVVTLRNALQLTKKVDILAQGPMLFLVGCFARNDVLFGSRGYRRTLLEAGEVTGHILLEAERLGLRTVPVYEFTDRDVDNVMEADGVEEGTLVGFGLGETVHVE